MLEKRSQMVMLGTTAIAVLLACCLPAAETIPKLTAKTLSGAEISLPGGANTAAYVLSFGFSRKSDKAMAAWDKLIMAKLNGRAGVVYYELPVMQGVPTLIRGAIHHGMRSSLPKPEHTRFAPLYMEEKRLKQIVAFSDPDAAYVVVATAGGAVVWQSHAPASESEAAALDKAVTGLLK